MLQIAICDDDPYMRAYLSGLCLRTLPGSSIHEYGDGKEIVGSDRDFDIVLMDIQMETVNGLEAVSGLRREGAAGTCRRPAVIFITAFNEHVFEALDLFPLHYLLKPLDEKKFERVLKLAAQSCLKHQKEEAIFFHTKSTHRRLYPSEIRYVESFLRKVIIHTAEESLEIYATMDGLEQKLGKGFFRCHRGYLVNLDYISGYDKQTIRLQGGQEVLMAKSKYASFVDVYRCFLQHGEIR